MLKRLSKFLNKDITLSTERIKKVSQEYIQMALLLKSLLLRVFQNVFSKNSRYSSLKNLRVYKIKKNLKK
jgi:hypothetical protein